MHPTSACSLSPSSDSRVTLSIYYRHYILQTLYMLLLVQHLAAGWRDYIRCPVSSQCSWSSYPISTKVVISCVGICMHDMCKDRCVHAMVCMWGSEDHWRKPGREKEHNSGCEAYRTNTFYLWVTWLTPTFYLLSATQHKNNVGDNWDKSWCFL